VGSKDLFPKKLGGSFLSGSKRMVRAKRISRSEINAV